MVVAVVAVVVDRAVRSAGKAFGIERDTGAAAMRPQSFEDVELHDQGLRLSRLCL